ncbi:hypothetical protein J2Z32_001244 [Paenibacillus turicensis]|uniref:DUF2877 domain-containing protein n=1 Tax=Paenibacillus turicensis TaxID=160487 RepID=A0ABS4FQ00_9BACL|nr:DUF2877 domain-containing protein [Paenibacillus turicensis]MBP1904621.1 hypothetical protein [Paenibacillus turicensis]
MNNHSLTFEKAYISSYVRQLILQHGSIQARIHSIFSNGFNLKYNDSLLFVGKNEESLSAIGLAINAADLELVQSALTVGDPVKISPFFSSSEEKLSLTFTCYTRPLVTTAIFPSIQSIDLSIPHVTQEQISKSGLLHHLEEADVWTQSGFASSQLTQMYDNFVSLISTSTVSSLIGAGVGLTPSGDDFLQGMILFEAITESGGYLKELVKQQLQHRSTTDVSLAYYEALFDGYVNAQWINLCAAILTENEQQLIEAIKKIQAYGATSGNDSLVGVLTFLKQKTTR